MLKFSIEADNLDNSLTSNYKPYFPTAEMMQESYEALKKLKPEIKKMKYGFAQNGEGIVDKISVVMDPKEYEAAQYFCDESSLYPISDFEKILEIVKTIMRSREEKIMKNDENTTIATTDKSELPDVIELTDAEQVDSSDEEPAEADAAEESELHDEIEEVDVELIEISDEEAAAPDEAEEELQEQSASKLPVVKKDDKSIILCKKGDVRLVMLPLYNAETLIIEKCKLFLVNANTNIPYLGAGAEMQVAKDRIMTAKDHTVFSIIKKFVINFSEDDIKLAFAMAKRFLETSPNMLAVNSSLNIIDAYREIVRRSIQRSEAEENTADSRIPEGRLCEYDREKKLVKIRDKYMQKILEDTGYTPVTFCKKICMTEVCTGYKILIHQQGRYTVNETGNQRFYKLCVIDELLEEKEEV